MTPPDETGAEMTDEDPFERDCLCVGLLPQGCRRRPTDPMPDWPEQNWIDLGIDRLEAWATHIPPEIFRRHEEQR